MMTLTRAALAAVSLLAVSAVGADIHTAAESARHMQLKSAGGAVECSAYRTPPGELPSCEIEPGTYLEQLFDADWHGVGERTVTVGAAPSEPDTYPAGGGISIVFETCGGDAVIGETAVTCEARCPSGSVSIATECGFNTPEHREMALTENFAGRCTWVSTDGPEGDGLRSVVADNFVVSTTCLAQ